MAKAYSTKILRPVPIEFEDNFVRHGQEVCEQMYGKRATMRYRFAIGVARLSRLRRQFVEARKQTAVTAAAGKVQRGRL